MENQKLQIQKSSKILLKTLEAQERGFNLKPSLAVAMERLDMEFKNIDNTIDDIFSEFSSFSLFEIKEAIRKGSLGKYGRTFKLNTQEICYWIRENRKEKTNKML